MNKPEATNYYDKHGRPVYIGDLLKVFHFATSNRHIFMYKKVLLRCGVPMAVDVLDLGEEESPHACQMSWLTDFEIIDGHVIVRDDASLVCWWERKKKKAKATSWP